MADNVKFQSFPSPDASSLCTEIYFSAICIMTPSKAKEATDSWSFKLHVLFLLWCPYEHSVTGRVAENQMQWVSLGWGGTHRTQAKSRMANVRPQSLSN